MAWTRFDATDMVDFADQLNDFMTMTMFAASAVAGSNTGNGLCVGTTANTSAVAETWTITLTSATAFTVSGSVTGSQAAGTVNEPYVNDYICFTVVAGSTAFVSSDSFTVAIASGTAEWSAERAITGNLVDTEAEYVWKGIGGGSEEIFIGMKAISDWSTYWNFDLQGLTGYISANSYETQPGYYANSDRAVLTSSSGSLSLWVWRSSRMIQIVSVLGGNYAHAYLGYMNPYGASSQYPYPLMIAGNTKDINATPAQASTHFSWWTSKTFYDESLRLLFGTWGWRRLGDYIYPYSVTDLSKEDGDILGNRELYPIILTEKGYSGGGLTQGIYGEVYNVYSVTNRDGAVSVTDTVIDEDLNAYMVTQDNGRVGFLRVVCVKLE